MCFCCCILRNEIIIYMMIIIKIYKALKEKLDYLEFSGGSYSNSYYIRILAHITFTKGSKNYEELAQVTTDSI